MGPPGYAGIGAGIVGAATLGAGIGLILRPDEVRGQTGQARGFTTQHLGVGMTVGGGVALAAGMVMLAVDLAIERDRSLAFVPTFGTRQVGLAITRRF